MLARKPIVCPECETAYPIDPDTLGADGRRVRCPRCRNIWFEPPPALRRNGASAVLDPSFPRKLKQYLNGLPDHVKRQSPKATHAIKSYLMRHGLGGNAVGYANGIKVDLQRFRNTEFMWDAAAKVPDPDHPSEDCDLVFIAESENAPQIEKILEDANKLPIARADVRLMFFRANDGKHLELFFERLYGLFRRHRKSEPGDIYILAGMDLQNCAYSVRKLTIRQEFSNVNPWEEF